MKTIFSSKEKFVKLAMIFLAIGWVYFWVICYLHDRAFGEILSENPGMSNCFPRPTLYQQTYFKVIAQILGIISFYFSLKAKTSKNIYKALLLLSSLFLIFLTFIFFPRFITEIDFYLYEMTHFLI